VLNKIDLVDDLAALRCWLSTHSAAAFRSWSYSWPEPVDRAALLDVLQDAAVLRGKGIVRLRDCPDRRSVVHLVGKRVDITDAGPWSDTDDSQLVLLGLRPVLGSLERE